jgi:hypothetical protein
MDAEDSLPHSQVSTTCPSPVHLTAPTSSEFIASST